MKGASRLVVLLLAAAAFAGNARAADREWVVGVGGGPLYPSTTEGDYLGPSASAWVAAPLQPWFLLGGEFGWYRVDGDQGLVFNFGGSSYEIDDYEQFTGTVMFRAQFPVRTGLSPFVAFGTGISWSTGGDVHVSGPGYVQNQVYPGPTEKVWAASVELGLKFAIPGPWPDPEIAVRKVEWLGEHAKKAVQPRFALTF